MRLIQLDTLYLLIAAIPTQVLGSSPSGFPTIDLGYARHVPTFINTTSQYNIYYATYRNIRFAQPPTGDLRFKLPVTPPPAADGIQDGNVPLNSTNCIQTVPHWLTSPPGINGTTWGNEDCLFLDVVVPEGLSPAPAGTGVPVLHWLYGGGFFFGAKDNGGNPAALLDAMTPDKKFIIVASNYRLGPLGWLSSDTEPTMDRNVGLYDAWSGLKWTNQFIYMFGGNPEKVTVMGQSAGGGIIQHFLAADAQTGSAPFSQAVLSSPGYRPHVNRSEEVTGIYNIFLNATNCTNVGCLRELPSEDLKKANSYMMLEQGTGEFGGPSIGFGPVIDGNLVRDVPDRVLNNITSPRRGLGNVKRVIAGGMRNDGIGNPSNETWADFLKIFARTPSSSTISTIQSLYSNDTDLSPVSSSGILEQTTFDKFYGDIIYECHSYFAAKYWSKGKNDSATTVPPTSATGSESYRYDESVPPAIHGDDMNYYFYDKAVAAVDKAVVPEVAKKFQNYLRRFILGEDMQGWPEYSAKGLESPGWVNITANGFEVIVGGYESVRGKRCETIVALFDKAEDGW